MTLGPAEIAPYTIKQRPLHITAVGAATYILHAQVRGARTNELVIKSVQIDVSSVNQYAYLDVRPSIVLPQSIVEVNWAVWDVKQVWLWVGGDHIELTLTEQGPSEMFQGSGVWRLPAPKKDGDVSVWMEILQKGQEEHKYRARDARFTVNNWIKNSDFSGKAIGMAGAAPKLALITAEKLWLADVGHTDPSTAPDFKEVRIDTPPKAWRAIAAF